MNMKRIVSSVLTATILSTTIVIPSYAEESFSTAKDFLSDVIDVSTSEVESQTLVTAKETILNNISVSGDEVFYDGMSIGYWYSDDSSKLFTDTTKTSTVISPDTEGYIVAPSLLHDMLYDLNELLEDNYVPSTTDWSKIIGKYDVTLGDITIPADQWLKADSFYDVTSDATTSAIQWNLTKSIGINADNVGMAYGSNSVHAFAWLIDDAGELYIQDGLIGIATTSDASSPWVSYSELTTASGEPYAFIASGSKSTPSSSIPYIQCGIINATSANSAETYGPTSDSTNTRLAAIFFTTDATATKYGKTFSYIYPNSSSTLLRKLSDPSVTNACEIGNAKAYGMVYMLGSQIGATNSATLHQKHLAMFDSYSTSKLVRGNQKLTRRLSALTSLLPTDTITVKSTGWTINGHDDIDVYISDQSLDNAGDTADIAAVADIDALKFHVVVPTSLPIYIDDANVTYVADNADVTNKSGAAVKITDVDIVPKQDSGWTMVDGTPTKNIEGHEFNFTTTIEKDKVLDVDEVYPFQYSAKLSPTAESSNSLELASVLVTVDWATT